MAMPTIKREFDADYEDVLARVPDALKKEGFGVLTTIDLKETLKKKIDVDYRRYMILGACNPKLAHQALEADVDVGVLLPCNVVVYERPGGGTVVAAVDPVDAIGAFGGEELLHAATEVRAMLNRALAHV